MSIDVQHSAHLRQGGSGIDQFAGANGHLMPGRDGGDVQLREVSQLVGHPPSLPAQVMVRVCVLVVRTAPPESFTVMVKVLVVGSVWHIPPLARP